MSLKVPKLIKNGSFTSGIPSDSYYFEIPGRGNQYYNVPLYIAVSPSTRMLYVLCDDTGVLEVQLTQGA